MVAYTDGITEAMNDAGVAFGVERLSEVVRTSYRQPAGAIREAVLSSLRKYIEGQHLLDDVTLLVIKPAWFPGPG
jgi:serine phosphatase RsbU (regulator of sigma subunit)